jgi:Protein of unknown function (DUF4236)
MGFYFRKSVRFGPFRVNFSKSGVGLSAGIPGFRIGAGPRGNYVQAGAHGFYYRATLPSGRARAGARATVPALVPVPRHSDSPAIPDNTLGAFTTIESGDAEQMVDSSSEALLEEIHSKHRRIRCWRWVAAISGFTLYVAWLNVVPNWALGFIAVAGLLLTAFAFRRDVQRKLTILRYDLNPASMDAFGRLMDAGSRMHECHRIWHLKGQARVLDRKYHAGASTTVSRAAASVGTRLPPYMASNIDPVAVEFTKLTLYFFPDRVLVYQGSQVGAVSYGALECHPMDTRFIEEDTPPQDAEVVGRTWRYVNKNGGPDRRFNNNRELPVCLYGELAFESNSGLQEVLQLSKATCTADFVAAISAVRRTAL